MPQPTPQPNPCGPGEIHDPTAPTGLTAVDPIRIIWFKPMHRYFEPLIIQGHEYLIDDPTHLPHGEPIGVFDNFFPFVGKIMLLRFEEDRGNEARFIAVLARYGFNLTANGLSPDHVQDLMWQGEDRFENLWPLDRGYNEEAGRRQNQNQIIYFRPDPRRPCARRMSVGRARQLFHMDDRNYIIHVIQEL